MFVEVQRQQKVYEALSGVMPGEPETEGTGLKTASPVFRGTEPPKMQLEHRFVLNDQPHVLEGTPYTVA